MIISCYLAGIILVGGILSNDFMWIWISILWVILCITLVIEARFIKEKEKKHGDCPLCASERIRPLGYYYECLRCLHKWKKD